MHAFYTCTYSTSHMSQSICQRVDTSPRLMTSWCVPPFFSQPRMQFVTPLSGRQKKYGINSAREFVEQIDSHIDHQAEQEKNR